MSQSDLEQETKQNLRNQHYQQQGIGIASIMEAFDKHSKLKGADRTEDNMHEDSQNDQIRIAIENRPKNNNNPKKIILDINIYSLKQEFEDLNKKKELDQKKTQNEAELKKLLNEVNCLSNEKNKLLESQYTILQNLMEEELMNSKLKPQIKHLSLKSLQYPQILDNRNQHKLDVTQWANTQDNINVLQDEQRRLDSEVEEINKKIMFDLEKQNSLNLMYKELKQTKNITQEQINNHDLIIQSYDKQIQQAEEKILKHQNDAYKSQVEINKYQKFLNADSKQKTSLISEKNKSLEDQKYVLKETLNEYKIFQNQLETARTENDKKIQEINEVKQKLRSKYQQMLESKRLMKDLDNFDNLTNIFVYGDPANSDLTALQKQILSISKKQAQQSSSQTKQEQEMEEYVNDDDNNLNMSSPMFKQGSIYTRLKDFYKLHGEDLSVIVEKILTVYKHYNMQNHTFQTRLEDLQQQKSQLSQQWRNLVNQENNENQEQNNNSNNLLTDPDHHEELSSPLRQRSDSEIVQQTLTKNRISQDDIHNLTSFIAYSLLFLNESLFRFTGITSIIKSIVNIQQNIRNDEKFQAENFQNQLFENLTQIMNFSVSIKGLYSVSTSQSAISKSNVQDQQNNNKNKKRQQQQQSENNLQSTIKILEIKKQFLQFLPELAKHQDSFTEIVQNDFILLNFCSLESFSNFFQSFKNKLENLKQKHSIDDIWKSFSEKIITKLKEEGRGPFNQVLIQLFQFIISFLSQLKLQKNKIHQKLLAQNPNSLIFKPSHLRKKLEDNKKRKQKDWKEKIQKNKIKQYENYNGTYYDTETTADHGLPILNEVGSVSLNDSNHEDEANYIDSVWKKEKLNFNKKNKEFIDLKEKIKQGENPKIISKYLEPSKYGLQYSDSWKYLIKSKKEFGTSVWDKDQQEFQNIKTLNALSKTKLFKNLQGDQANSANQKDKNPELLFSHVMYQQTHPNLEPRYHAQSSSRLRLNTIQGTFDEIQTLQKQTHLPGVRTDSTNQLAHQRQLSDQEKRLQPKRIRSQSNIGLSQTNSVQISKSRMLNSRDENKLIHIKTDHGTIHNNHNKLKSIYTESALAPIKANTQLQ